MEGFAIAIFINMVSSFGENIFKNFFSKFKRQILCYQLKREIKEKILKEYGSEIYYNALDKFLSNNTFTERIISRCYYNESTIETAFSNYIVVMSSSFIEKNPEFISKKSCIESILTKILIIIFNKINDFSLNETARLVINNLNIKNEKINAKLDKLLLFIKESKKTKIQSNIQDDEQILKGIAEYKETQAQLFLKSEQYISRNIFSKNDTPKTSMEMLLKEKKILLLGEPGCGKTYETLNLLCKIYDSSEFMDKIPIYLRLIEYGIKYKSIIDTILNKLSPFILNLTQIQIIEWLRAEKFVMILDGTDEITKLEFRISFFSDLNEILSYTNGYCFITSRINQYHGNINGIIEFNIMGLSKSQISDKLGEKGIYVQMPEIYYELFAIPLFLEIGIKVLSSGSGVFHNKSQLFEEYIRTLCYGREVEKGILIHKKNYYETLMIIGKLAFDFFESPYILYSEFDKFFYDLGSEYTSINICDIFRIDIFSITDNISFIHKQFKEFFASYYLVNKYPFDNNTELYKKLMKQEAWQEVLIFATGIINNINVQNEFLNTLLCINLRTYIQSVKLKNDLSNSLSDLTSEKYAKYYLTVFYNSYYSIIDTYFLNIKHFFEPSIGNIPDLLADKKPCIIGIISSDKRSLHYWFDWKDKNEDEIQVIQEVDIPAYHEDMMRRAVEESRNIISHGVNLDSSKLLGDSARTVAINLIRENLLQIIKKYNLYDSHYLICEKLYSNIKNNNEIKDKSIGELVEWSDKYIDDICIKFKNETGELIEINYNGIDLTNLNQMAHDLNDKGIEFQTHLLPQPDQKLMPGSWIWGRFSKDQTVNRIKKFFLWRETSYFYMINRNFPAMNKYFQRAIDYPYKYKIFLEFKDKNEGMLSEPWLTYYHISISADDSKEPEVIICEKNPKVSDESCFKEIIDSYHVTGKESQNAHVTSTVFSMVLHDHKTSKELPLTSCVYDDFKNDIEKLFGKK